MLNISAHNWAPCVSIPLKSGLHVIEELEDIVIGELAFQSP